MNEEILAELDKIQASVDKIRALLAPPPLVLPPKSKGIDVSHYQGTIDWKAVKAFGIVYAFIKATESANITDSAFSTNWNNAKAAGVARGAYHFYRFGTDPVAQANYFVAQILGDLGELQPVLDAEDTATPAHADDLRVFCERVFTITGKRCIIYTGNWWWTVQRLGGAQPWVKDYPLWIAYWSATVPKPPLPVDWTTWAFWQYTNSGNVSGISGAVDLDVSYG